MSWELSTESIPISRKIYNCQAAEFLSYGNKYEFEQEDIKIIEDARLQDFKILKGTKYFKIKGKYDGEFSTFRARLDIHNICIKYDLYPDD